MSVWDENRKVLVAAGFECKKCARLYEFEHNKYNGMYYKTSTISCSEWGPYGLYQKCFAVGLDDTIYKVTHNGKAFYKVVPIKEITDGEHKCDCGNLHKRSSRGGSTNLVDSKARVYSVCHDLGLLKELETEMGAKEFKKMRILSMKKVITGYSK